LILAFSILLTGVSDKPADY